MLYGVYFLLKLHTYSVGGCLLYELHNGQRGYLTFSGLSEGSAQVAQH